MYIQALRKLNERALSTGNPGAPFFARAYDDAGTWTNKSSIFANDGASATTSSNNPLRIYTDITHNTANSVVVGVQVYIFGMKDAGTTSAEICMSIDGATCYGPYIPIPLPVGSIGGVAVGDTDGAKASMLSAWLNPNQRVPNIYETKGASGLADNVGSTVTLRVGSSSAFDSRWTSGTHIIYDGADYTVSAVNSGTEIVISGSPANGTFKSWTAANFGFHIRKSSAGGTITVDSVQMAYLFYASHQTNGGSGSNLPCTGQRYHDGWRIGGPTGVYTNAATNTAPIVIRTTTNHDFVTGDIVKVYNVPGNVAANGTWPITVLGPNTFSLTGSDGRTSGAFPTDVNNIVGDNGGGLVYRSGGPRGEAATGSLCFMLDGEGNTDLYWMNPDTTPVDMRYLGVAWTYPHNGLPGIPGLGPVDASDPDAPAAYRIINVNGTDELWTARYIGNQNHGMFHDIGTRAFVGPDSDVWGWRSLTPSPNTFQSKILAFDPTASEQSFGLDGGAGAGYMIISGKPPGGAQNGLLWIGVYDLINNQVVALTNSWKSSNCRWCGVHTLFAFGGTDKIAFVPYNLGGLDTQSDGSLLPVAWEGPYRLAPTAPLNTTTDIGDCASKLSSIGQPNPLNVTGNLCSTINLSSVLPITPANFTPANDTRFNTGIRVGDIMGSTTASGNIGGLGFDDGERLRILGISGNTIVVQRAVSSPAVAKTSGWYLFMLCYPIPRWWDWRSAPRGETGTDPYSQGINGIYIDPPFAEASHYFTHGALSVDDSGGGSSLTATFPGFRCPDVAGGSAPYAFRTWPWPQHLDAPLSAYGCTKGNPPFGSFAGKGNGNFLEKHPSPIDNQVISPAFLDARPYGGLNTESLQTVNKVGTYVYKVTGYNIEAPFNEKYSRLYIGIGHRTAYDVSAPGFTLPDTSAYWYTYCFAHVAGECWAGSSAGDVYVNSPRVAKVPNGYHIGSTDYSGQYRCLSKGEAWSILDLDDICVTVQAAYAETAVQYSSSHDPFNTGARRITAGLNYPRTSNNLWNVPPTVNADWMVNWGGLINEGARYLSTLVRLPPYPGPQRGIFRGDYMPLPVKIANVPVGTNNVLVEFGYNPSLYCTTRQEVCVANATSITPTVYNFAISDTYSGLACSSGCTPVIPALSQRIMWYRVKYRNAGNAVIKVGDVQTMATP